MIIDNQALACFVPRLVTVPVKIGTSSIRKGLAGALKKTEINSEDGMFIYRSAMTVPGKIMLKEIKRRAITPMYRIDEAHKECTGICDVIFSHRSSVGGQTCRDSVYP